MKLCNLLGASLLGLGLLALGAPSMASGQANPMRGPVAAQVPHGLLTTSASTSVLFPPAHADDTGLVSGLVDFYRRVVSAVDGDRCHMAPTCSLYGRTAIAVHGPLLGLVLTADRLLHESDEMAWAKPIRRDGELYYPDPLEANTYWLPAFWR